MPKRNYSNTASPQTLSSAVNTTATTLTVGSTTGYPNPPFLLGLERGTANEEVCLCTAKTGTTFTVTRAYDGTTGKDHAAGSLLEHTVAAIDYREAGIIQVTTAERDALAGADLWEGRTVYNLDTDNLETFNGSVWSTSSLTAGQVMTTAQRDALSGGALFEGLVIYNTDTDTLQTYDGSSWNDQLGAPLAGGPTDVIEHEALFQPIHNRRVNLIYTSGVLTGVEEKTADNVTLVKDTDLNYTNGVLTSVVETVNGRTITTTLNYSSGVLTSVTRAVA